MPSVILSGASGALGERVRQRLAARGVSVSAVGDDAAGADLKARLEGSTSIVHLAGGLEITRALLDAAGGVGVEHVVLLSSATVYGARAGNPVPLTEDAPVRPEPTLDFAVRAAERERLAGEWRLDHPGTAVAVLRPVVPVAAGARGWLADGLLAAATIRGDGTDDPPVQYVHLDDLAEAIVVATTERLAGVFNVAPDGWMSGEAWRALAGRPQVRLPEQAARRLSRLWARLGLAPAPDGLAPYATHPWVVANDRLKAVGWVPAHTNEEAFVDGHEPLPWATVSPQRRQELALGAMVAALAGVVVGGVALVRRRRRRAGS